MTFGVTGTIWGEDSSKQVEFVSYLRELRVPTLIGPRFLRLLSKVLTVIVALVVAVLLVGYGINFHTRQRAEYLLRDLRTLQVNTSTAQAAMQLVSRYGGWKMDDPDPHDVAP